ncbi:MAG: ATP-binding protein [Dehalococcoidia bacterium]|nr:ATP-binding protein [Dehalococcoidia bacterium]
MLAVLLTALSAGVYFYLSRSLYRSLDDSLELRSKQICTVPPILESIWQGEFQEELGEIVTLYFYTGNQLVEVSPPGISISLSHEFIYQAINGRSSFTTIEAAEDQGLRLLAVPIHLGIPGLPLSTQPGALIIGRSTKQIDQALHGLVRTLVIAVPLALALAAGGGIFLARRALKPVDKIAHTAEEIEETDLSRRINVNTKDELGRLAATLNAMIGRLEKAFQRQKQFTSDASHELRTPLAVIEAESTLALQKERPPSDYRQSLETISQESRQMSSLIDQLLTLARADAGKEQWNFTEVNLGKLISNLSTDIEVLCQEKGLSFQLGQAQDLVVKCDEARLRELFMNLLDNAIRYTPSPGTISVSLHREGQMAVVAITDTGIGIPAEDIPFIFERFYRVDKSRSRVEGGSGLGLAISRHIAEAHEGKIEVESQVGSGSTFSVWLLLQST